MLRLTAKILQQLKIKFTNNILAYLGGTLELF